MVGELLAEKMRHDRPYEQAMREAIKFDALPFEGRYPAREEARRRGLACAMLARGARREARGRIGLQVLRAWPPWPVDDVTVDLAWEIQDRWQLSIGDAMIVAAAQMQRCEMLLTEDLQHDQRIDKVRIVNPFMAGPELLDA